MSFSGHCLGRSGSRIQCRQLVQNHSFVCQSFRHLCLFVSVMSLLLVVLRGLDVVDDLLCFLFGFIEVGVFLDGL